MIYTKYVLSLTHYLQFLIVWIFQVGQKKWINYCEQFLKNNIYLVE